MTSPTTPPVRDLEDAPAGTPLVDLADTVQAAPVDRGRRKLPGHRSRVILDAPDHPDAVDGLLELVARVDNRDYLRWDHAAAKNKWPSASDAPFLVSSYTSWNALQRAGLYAKPFAVFERECLEVAEVTDEEEEDTARPTR